MEELQGTMELISTIQLSITVFVLVLFFAVVGVVLYRFRLTVAGFLVAGAYGGFALLVIVSLLVFRVAATDMTTETFILINAGLDAVDVLLTLILAVGIGFIPRSLRKLKASKAA